MDLKLKGVDIKALPHLGIYNPETYYILPIDKYENGVTDYPIKLLNQIMRIQNLMDNAQVDYMTLTHSGRDLSGFCPDEVNLNLILHPYIFSNDEPGGDYKATVKCGVYLPESDISQQGIIHSDKDGVSINPTNILDANLFIHYHPGDNDSLCFSPDNAKLKVLTTLPIHTFYTLTLVSYKQTIARILIAKHILILNDSLLSQHVMLLFKESEHGSKENILSALKNNFIEKLPRITESFKDINEFIEIISYNCENINSVKRF